MHKGRLLVFIALVLVCVTGIFVGCAGNADAYSGMRIKASKSTVSLCMELTNDGQIDKEKGKLSDEFSVTVSNAPDTISKAVSATSLDPTVATAQVLRTSGGKTYIRVEAVSNGKTQIKAMAGGGGSDIYETPKYALIDVVVDIPPVAMAVKDNVYFGVTKGGTVTLTENSFKFYASESKTSGYTTTLNSVSYEFTGDTKTAALAAGCEINDSVLKVGTGYVGNTIELKPTLSYKGIESDEVIVVHVFDEINLNDVTFDNADVSTISGIPTVELIKNEGDNDTASCSIKYKNSSNGLGSSWGYEIAQYDNSILYINNASSTGNFELVSMGTGETDVNIVVFPVKNIDGKLVQFKQLNLQKTKKIKVEIRNVFLENQLKFTKKVSELKDEIISDIDVFFVLDSNSKASAVTEFSLGITGTDNKLSGIEINNTSEQLENNFVTFDVANVGIGGTAWKVWEVFNISYKLWPYTGKSIAMLQNDFETGVPYNAQFSISLKNGVKSAFWTAGPKLIVKSIYNNNVKAEINANFIHEISSVTAVVNYSAYTGEGVEINMLSPVIDGTKNTQFYLVSTEKNEPGWFSFVFEDDADDYFNVADFGSTGTNEHSSIKNYASLFRLEIDSSLGKSPDLNKRYYVNAVHKCGVSVRLGIQVLKRLELESSPTLGITPVSGDKVYDIESSGSKFTAFVQIGGTYSVDLAYSANALKGYSIPDVSALNSAGLVIIGNIWRPTKEAVHSFRLNLNAYNIDVFPAGMHQYIDVELIVINPVVAVSFSKNNQTVSSAATLGLSPALGLNHTESFVEFDLLFNFDGEQSSMGFDGSTYQKRIGIDFSFAGMKGPYSSVEGGVTKQYYGNGIIELWQNPENPTNFKLQGLQKSDGNIDICFYVYQIYKVGSREVRVDFLSSLDRYNPTAGTDEGSHFFVEVKDAVTVENIFVANAGSSLDITLDMNAANTDVVATELYLRTSVQPFNAYNTRLGFGFMGETADTLVQTVRDATGDIISIDKLTGRITARKSNISNERITLVVYALDSLTGDNTFPGTCIKIPVYIYDKTTTKNERVIRNLEELLEAFYIKPQQNDTRSFTDLAKLGLLSSRSDLGITDSGTVKNCYYQLAADIDLSPVYEGGKFLPVITDFGKSGTAVFSGAKPSSTGEKECYSILNLKFSEVCCKSYSNIEYYGMFDIIGAYATIDSITFKNVTGSISPGYVSGTREHAFGVLAGANKGAVKNVSVEFSNTAPVSFSIGVNTDTANIGGIVGRNEVGGKIIEDLNGRVNISGGITVKFAVSSSYSSVNFGSLVGLNNGTIECKFKNNVLSGDAPSNSDAVLALIGCEEKELHDKYVNIGGIAGANDGASAVINGASSECVIYNSVTENGNTGGLVGHNKGGAKIINSFSNSAIYARNAMGGVVGRNTGVASGTINTIVEKCYYENYLNDNVKEKLMSVLNNYVSAAWWGGVSFYAGLITDSRVNNVNVLNGNPNYLTNSPTTIGGVVGINESGDVKYSFASSMFDNKTERVDYFDLPYKGDICILGTRNAVVGGVIGRQDYAASKRSTIEGCYSTLTIYSNYLNQEPEASDDIKVGGIIGYINNASADIKYCYSNIDLRLVQHSTYGKVSFGGFVGAFTGSNTVSFNYCYSRVLAPVLISSGNDTSVACSTDTSRVETASTWIGTPSGVVSHNNSLFITGTTWTNTLPSPFAYGTNTRETGYNYPVLMDDDGQLFVVAVPNVINLQLKGHSWYKDNVGNVKNNRGGHNLVVPHDSITNRAAIFYSGGSFTASSKVANRYYLDELFGVDVDPEIAKNRIAYSIEGAGTDVVVTGYELHNGSPKYFIELKKSGVSFDLVVSATRFQNGGGNLTLVNERIKFDIVNSAGYNTAFASVSGVVGRNSLDNKGNIQNGFSVQTNTRFNLSGQVNTTGWSVQISAVGMAGTQPSDISKPTTGYGSVTYSYTGIGSVDFELIPSIKATDGTTEYLCKALLIEVTANVYGGAIDVKFEQSANGGSTIDGSTSVACEGIFVSDIAGVGATDEKKLLNLAGFSIIIDKTSYPLPFTNNNKTIIKNIGGQSVDLIFELKVNKVVLPGVTANKYSEYGSYTEYHFSVLVSVAVNEKLFSNLNEDEIREPVIAFKEGLTVSGTIYMREIARENGSATKTATTTVKVIAQDLQTAEFQHYANTQTSGGILIMNEDQQQSMNVYTQNDLKGLMKVYAHPYYANITEFSLAMDPKEMPCLQKVGYTNDKQKLPIYEKWEMAFVQMVWDGRQYVNLPGSTGNYNTERGRYDFYQVSSYNPDNKVYSWDGVYYIQTMLVETKLQYIWKGEKGDGSGEPTNLVDLKKYATEQTISRHTMRIQNGVFNIKAEFITNGGRKIERSLKMFAIEKPGLYFEVDGKTVTETEQAIGTTMNIGIKRVPADKVTINSISVTASYENEVGGEVDCSDKVTYDVTKNSLEVSADINLNALIKVTFGYTQIESNGAKVELESVLYVRPVLFKVRGFTVSGVGGNTIRLANGNRYTMKLMADVVHADESNVTSAQMARIVKEIDDFNKSINQDTYNWTEWTFEGQKLNTNWDSATEYYNGSMKTELKNNFFLGKYFTTSEKFILDSVGTAQTSMLYIDVYYEYKNGIPSLAASSHNRLTKAYQISTVDKSAEKTLTKIYQNTSYLLRNMTKDNDYILMEDIELNDWTPVEFMAKSLDGNNKRININSFNLSSHPTNIGLFSTVGTGCLIKNLNVSLPNKATVLDLNLSSYTNSPTVNIGLLAGINRGIITNCAVVNNSQFDQNSDGIVTVNYENSTFDKSKGKGLQQVVISIQSPNLTVHSGGLVGENAESAVISNSRVMIDIVINSANGDSTSVNVKNIIAAGFAAVNEGTIVSSFFRDGNILNYAKIGTDSGLYNKTAGFVGENKGIIKGSYAMGVADAINSDSGCVIFGEIKSNNNVAGFAYENAGTIEDCLVNVRITMANTASGFVDNNNGGTIRNCFVNNEKSENHTYYAFVNNFVAVKEGTVDNCKYVGVGRNFSGTSFTLANTCASLKSSDEENGYKNITSFQTVGTTGNPFSISDANNPVTIWKMTGKGPVLVSANDIAISIRIVEAITDANKKEIINYSPYALGSKKNPILITNGEEFNSLIYKGSQADMEDRNSPPDYGKNIYGEHIRLVNNISLDQVTIQTYKTIFQGVLDGNGLSINNISFFATSDIGNGLNSIGLFSSVQDATIKNVTLTVSTIKQSGATYVGGLAGTAFNSNLVDINVVGTAEIVGKSIVGGLVGYIEINDNIKVENLKANIPVRAELYVQTNIIPDTQRFENADDYLKYGRTNGYDSIGIAGGVIGLVSGSGEVRFAGNYGGATMGVTGEIVGGIIGAVDYEVTVSGSRYVTAVNTNVSALRGKYYVGGLVGINLGEVVNGKIALPIMNIQSAADNNGTGEANMTSYVFRSESKGNYYGMTVGGAVGFNRGNVDSVVAQVGMNSKLSDKKSPGYNFAYVLVVGGVVGENFDGTVTECIVGGEITSGTTKVNTVINGGYYIGGIVGKNYGNNTTIITGNAVNYASWGANILANSGNVNISTNSDTVFVGPKDEEYKVMINSTTFRLAFFNYGGSPLAPITARAQFTGAYVGVNFDAKMVFDGSTIVSMPRNFGSYSVTLQNP